VWFRREKAPDLAAYETLESLGISLPPATAPVAAFVPWVRSGDLRFTSGHIAKKDGKPWSAQLGVCMASGASAVDRWQLDRNSCA
jgi:hypothetical protein